jgi:hypothetical protein
MTISLLLSEGEVQLILATWAGVGVAIFLALWHGWLQRDHNEHVIDNDKKNLQMRGLVLVFEKLNGDKQRYARKKIFSAYYQCLKQEEKPTEFTPDNFKDHPVYNIVDFNKSVLTYAENVRADLEEIAVMIKNELVEKEAYFDAYWGSMLRCFMALHGFIEATRDKSGTKHYTTYLEQQSYDALRYWRDKHPDSKITFYAD